MKTKKMLFNILPPCLQKAVNRIAKDRLLHAKRPPFATQKVAFWKAVGKQLIFNEIQNTL